MLTISVLFIYRNRPLGFILKQWSNPRKESVPGALRLLVERYDSTSRITGHAIETSLNNERAMAHDMKKYSPAELENYPGYHIRRLQQIAVAVFVEETSAWGVTPVQYAALSAVLRKPHVDQRTLARLIGFDASTIGSVIDRLEARGLIARIGNPKDRRSKMLEVTAEGRQLLLDAEPAVLKAQERMLDPLPPGKRKQFMETLAFLTEANGDIARAPANGSFKSGSEGA